jgi:hypothetical protein
VVAQLAEIDGARLREERQPEERATVNSWLRVLLLFTLRDYGGVMDRVVAQLLAEIDGVQVSDDQTVSNQMVLSVGG